VADFAADGVACSSMLCTSFNSTGLDCGNYTTSTHTFCLCVCKG